MKARLLKKLLDDTGYAISNHHEYIAVGSPLCHDLISVNKKTLKLRYALDAFNEGRAALQKDSQKELLFIWDKLAELIDSGQIHEVMNGRDEIENPLPVFTVTDGELVGSITDAYGWPNTDDNGICMYENTHFPTKGPAIQYGVIEYTAGMEQTQRRINEIEEDLAKFKERFKKYSMYVNHLNTLKLAFGS